ncbi:MAG TPA: sensor histidine kinase [Vicinamibacterales bacterium]|nr:sensor histidine kinase [Vicinamibacterales bacterium]
MPDAHHAVRQTVHPSPQAGAIAGYRTFVAIVAVNYFALIALTPRTWGARPSFWPLAALSVLYLALGIWGFEFAQRVRRLPVSLAYLLIEFGIGMRLTGMAPGGLLPLILLPLAAQAVALLPRAWAALMCMLVIAGVSGNLSWVPTWPIWFRNLASATAAVVFVVVYVGVAAREREARQRVEKLSGEVAQLAAANERNRLAREIHDTLGHYLTVIHVQLEAARALVRSDPERGLLAINRAQTLAKDGLTAVRQSVKALREDARVEGIAEQLASLVDASRDETFRATFTCTGQPRPVSAAVALALHRTALEALTNVRRHAAAARVAFTLAYRDDGRVELLVEDDGRGAAGTDGGFGLVGIRERAEQLGGSVAYRTAPGAGFAIRMELPG